MSSIINSDKIVCGEAIFSHFEESKNITSAKPGFKIFGFTFFSSPETIDNYPVDEYLRIFVNHDRHRVVRHKNKIDLWCNPAIYLNFGHRLSKTIFFETDDELRAFVEEIQAKNKNIIITKK